MVFSGIPFLFFFLPAVLLVYFITPPRLRNAILFIFSLLFYAWGEPIYILIMLFSTVFDYTNGLLIERFEGSEKKRKAILIIDIIGNLGVLFFFKYSDFFIQNINNLFSAGITPLGLALPIGISFYTFQTMSYTIDVYRREVKAQKNIISFGAYVTLFPQLIAGPIVQYKTIESQLVNSYRESFDAFFSGMKRFCCGLAKKVLVANNIGMLWTAISSYAPDQISTLNAWLGIIAFALQIYFDFSGYSDMAIGLGKMFGFEFLENFNYPYISKTVTEFWRRWHISLGTWFREYVYIPLGGNRKSVPRTYFNILAVWFLTGFWHGASWNFAIWGLYFATILIIEKLFLAKLLTKLPSFVSHVYALILILFGWVIFSFESTNAMLGYFSSMLTIGPSGFCDASFIYNVSSYAFMLIVAIISSTPIFKTISQKISSLKYGDVIYGILSLTALFASVAYLVDSSYNPFLYFRF